MLVPFSWFHSAVFNRFFSIRHFPHFVFLCVHVFLSLSLSSSFNWIELNWIESTQFSRWTNLYSTRNMIIIITIMIYSIHPDYYGWADVCTLFNWRTNKRQEQLMIHFSIYVWIGSVMLFFFFSSKVKKMRRFRLMLCA